MSEFYVCFPTRFTGDPCFVSQYANNLTPGSAKRATDNYWLAYWIKHTAQLVEWGDDFGVIRCSGVLADKSDGRAAHYTLSLIHI